MQCLFSRLCYLQTHLPHEMCSATIGEEAITLEDVYEPYLMQLGFLTRTPRGRCVTQLAYEHLHIAYQGQTQFDL